MVAFLIDGTAVLVPGIALASTQFETLDAAGTGRTGTDFCHAYTAQYSGGACFNMNDTVYFDDGGFSAVSLAPLAFSLLLFVVIQGLTGRTLGKLLLGLRTVQGDGSIVGIPRALLRWVLLVIDSLPCLGLLGLITAASTHGHRRVGDMAAKTFVVRSSAAGAPIVVSGLAPSVAAPVTAPPPISAGPGGPQWDPARNTYIQWDPAQSRWYQWDEATQAWTMIPGQ